MRLLLLACLASLRARLVIIVITKIAAMAKSKGIVKAVKIRSVSLPYPS